MSDISDMPDLFSRRLEQVEIDAFSDFYRSADADIVSQCGIGLPNIGSACITIASRIDVLAMNRVIGLGLNEPADDDVLDRIIETYREAGVPRFFIQTHPLARPLNITEMLQSKGLLHYNNWIKLYRRAEPLPAAKTDLQIEEIGPERGPAFAEIVTSCFGWPGIMRPWIAAVIGRPDWRWYMAFDNENPVATAASYIDGEYAWIDFAATMPEYRGKGAQSALAERRVRDIIDLGCKWLVVETAEETPEKSAPSFRNMGRLGFEIAYVRPNYIITLR
jgi:GNAT superfamily N-acetyltransferase